MFTFDSFREKYKLKKFTAEKLLLFKNYFLTKNEKLVFIYLFKFC